MTKNASATGGAGAARSTKPSAVQLAAWLAVHLAVVSGAQAATTSVTKLGSLPAEVAVGSGLTLTATVTKATAGFPTGKVVFKDGSVVLRGVTVSSGRASLVLPAYGASGVHSYTATFVSSSTAVSGSTSQGWTVSAKYPTSTALTVFPGTRAGQMIAFQVGVQAGGAAAGTVRILDKVTPVGGTTATTTVLGNVAVSNGQATLFKSPAAEGTHVFTAEYLGDTATLSSRSDDVAVTLAGRDYFVGSGPLASDANDGSEGSPWATLDKISKMNGLVNRDGVKAKNVVRLQCGGEWREQLTLTPAMVADPKVDRVEVSTWGLCSSNLPRINAGVRLEAGRWQRESGNVYAYRFKDGELPGEVTQLFIRNGANFVQMQEARHPNNGLLTIGGDPGDWNATPPRAPESHQDVLKVAAADHAVILTHGVDALKGAHVHLRSAQFEFEDRAVLAYAADGAGGGTLQFGSIQPDHAPVALNTAYGATYGFGYMLTGKAWMIDQPSEWAYDRDTQTLRFSPPAGVDPNTLVIEGAVRDHGIKVSGVKVNLSKLAVRLARTDGVSINAATGSLLQNLDVAYSGEAGMSLDMLGGSSTDVTFRANKIAFSRAAGLVTNSARSGVVIDGNTVSDTGNYLEPHGAGSGIAVSANGYERSVIRNNNVLRSAHHGIVFSNVALPESSQLTGTQRLTQVVGNTVDSYCERLDDCGGIYTYAGNHIYEQTDETGKLLDRGSLLEGNVVKNGVGSIEGTPSTQPTGVTGIYLDDYTTNITVSKNVITTSPNGLVLHNNSRMQVLDNQFLAVGKACLVVDNTGLGVNDKGAPSMNFDGLRDIPPITVKDNTCVAGGAYGLPPTVGEPTGLTQHLADAVVVLQNGFTPLTGLGSVYNFSGNRYQSLYGRTTFDLEEWFQGQSRSVNLTGWASKAEPTAAAMVEGTPILAPYRFTPVGGNLVSNSSMDLVQPGGNWLAGWVSGGNAIQDAMNCGDSGSGACGEQPNVPSWSKSVTATFGLKPGADYEVSVRMRTPNREARIVDAVELQCAGIANDAVRGFWSYQQLPSTGWHQVKTPFRTPSVEDLTKGRCAAQSLTGTFIIDTWPLVRGATGLPGVQWDDLIIREGVVQYGTTADDYRIVVNTSDTPGPVACPDTASSNRCGQYVDLDRKPVNWADVVPAHRARIVIWTGSTFYNPQ